MKQEFKEFKNIKLSGTEKAELFSSIGERVGVSFNPYAPVPTPFWQFILGARYAKVLIAACLIIVFSGATASASLNSLPGDILYPIKTKVVEKVQDMAAFTLEDKARRNADKVEKRIEEFEALAERGELSDKNTAALEQSISRDLEDFDRNVSKIKEKENKNSVTIDQRAEFQLETQTDAMQMEEKTDIEASFEANLKEHREKIKEIRRKEEVKNREALEAVLERMPEDRNREHPVLE